MAARIYARHHDEAALGVGPRVCIGAHFALVEATLALAKLVGTFRIELIDREPVVPIGIVTELLGIPVFILILSRARRAWV